MSKEYQQCLSHPVRLWSGWVWKFRVEEGNKNCIRKEMQREKRKTPKKQVNYLVLLKVNLVYTS